MGLEPLDEPVGGAVVVEFGIGLGISNIALPYINHANLIVNLYKVAAGLR